MQQTKLLLGYGLLVAHRLPMASAADPDAGVAIESAEIFAELVAFHVGAGGNDRGVAIDAHDHFADIDRLIAELAALAGRENVLFAGDLAEGSNADIIVAQGSLRKIRVPMQAGFFCLSFQIDDLADDVLIASIERLPGTDGDVLRGQERSRKQQDQQERKLFGQEETSAAVQGHESGGTGYAALDAGVPWKSSPIADHKGIFGFSKVECPGMVEVSEYGQKKQRPVTSECGRVIYPTIYPA